MMDSRRLRHRIISSSLAVAAGIVVLFCYGRRGADGSLAAVHIGGDSPRGVITIQLLAHDGKPLAGVEVASESGSGTAAQVTDQSGIAQIQAGESEVLGLYLGGTKVWASPYAGWILEPIFSPSCVGGMRFRVKLKWSPP